MVSHEYNIYIIIRQRAVENDEKLFLRNIVQHCAIFNSRIYQKQYIHIQHQKTTSVKIQNKNKSRIHQKSLMTLVTGSRPVCLTDATKKNMRDL